MPNPPENEAKKAVFHENTCNSFRATNFLADMVFVRRSLWRNEAILGGQSDGSGRRFAGGRDKHGSATPRGKRCLDLGVSGV